MEFPALTTSRFDRELRKLALHDPELPEHYRDIPAALKQDPYNRSGGYLIKKLDGVQADDCQYRIRSGRFRFRYDIQDQSVYLSFAFAGIAALDILVNNAGIGLVGGVEQTELADFERLFRVNGQGMFLATRAAMPLLLASRGSMVNIGSVAGLAGVEKRFPYCDGNCIFRHGGYTVCRGLPGEISSAREREGARRAEPGQPVGRLGRPEEIANMVLYLCSPEAEFVTGSVLTIDGGWTVALRYLNLFLIRAALTLIQGARTIGDVPRLPGARRETPRHFAANWFLNAGPETAWQPRGPGRRRAEWRPPERS